jgi:hypothetical protein
VMDAWGWVPEEDGEHIYLPKSVNAHDIRVVISALEDLHLVWEQAKERFNKLEHRNTQGQCILFEPISTIPCRTRADIRTAKA